MKKRDKVLAAFRRILLGDVYRRLYELEARVGSLGSEVLPAGHWRSGKPLAVRVADLERLDVLRQANAAVRGSDFVG